MVWIDCSCHIQLCLMVRLINFIITILILIIIIVASNIEGKEKDDDMYYDADSISSGESY
jgi:hypothetical protein